MSRRSRQNLPPFEVMRKQALGGSVGDLPKAVANPIEPIGGAGAEPTELAEGGLVARWWAGALRPVVLRIPQGYAVVLGFGFLGLIVLAYWAGQSRGHHEAVRQRIQAQAGLLGAGDGVSGVPGINVPARGGERRGGGELNAQAPARGVVGALPYLEPGVRGGGGVAVGDGLFKVGVDPGSDPRQDGLNYFVLAHYPEAEATRLVRFLWEEGVESIGVLLVGKSVYQVIALQGFGKDALNGAVRDQFEQQLRRLGRAWKKRKMGPDFSKSGIYLDLYEGETVAGLIMKESQP